MERECLDYPGLGEVSRLVEKKFRLTTMPTPTADWNGKIVQYIGTTGPVYKQGFFYRCQNAGYDYEWKVISVEPNLGQTIQYSTMPTANQSTLGNIVQYVGTTNQNYTNGLFYQCVALDTDPVTYGWQQKDVSDTSNKENTFRFTTMPTAAAEYYGKVVQYIGSTTSDYTHNYWYECKEESGTFYWENVETQDVSTKEDKFRYSTMPTATAQDVGRIVQYIGDSITNSYQKGYYYKGVNNSGAYSWQETQVQDVSGKENVFRYATMPTAGQDYNGKIVQFIGTTNANYTNGFFYKCVVTEEGGTVTYAWQNVPTQDVTNKEDKFRFSTMPTASATWLGKTVEYTGATTSTYTHSKRYECQVVPESNPTAYEWVEEAAGTQDSRISSEIVKIGVRIDDGYRPYIIFDPVQTITSFSNMGLAEILDIVDMYYNGDVSLADIQSHWTAGQSISLDVNATDKNAAQTVDMILMDINHDTLQTAEGEITKSLLTLGFMLNESISFSSPYSSSELNTWLNGDGLDMLPSSIKSRLKTVEKYVDGGFPDRYHDGVTATINAKAFIPTCPEVIGRNINGGEIGGGTYYFSTGGGSRYAAHGTITRSKAILTASGWAKATGAPNWYTGIVGANVDNTAFTTGESGFMPHICI